MHCPEAHVLVQHWALLEQAPVVSGLAPDVLVHFKVEHVPSRLTDPGDEPPGRGVNDGTAYR